MTGGDVPFLLTVPEAARALRIGRATAYDLAHAWLDSGGTKGLPVVTIGRSLRVPTAAIDRLIALGGFGPAWESGIGSRKRGSRSLGVGDAEEAAGDSRRAPGNGDTANPSSPEVPGAGEASQLSLFDTSG